MRDVSQESLGGYTTLRLGGPAKRVIEVTNSSDIVDAVRAADQSGERFLILAGGSNVVIGDAGFPGTVLLLRSGGSDSDRLGFGRGGDGRVAVTVPAGMVWDQVVDACVAQGWAGIECLSGIPGSAGATPIQNVGAYGQEVARTIVEVTVYDRETDEVRSLRADECGFAYRTSRFKGVDRWIVLSVSFVLREGGMSTPIRYAQLAGALGVEEGDEAPVPVVREAVLALRQSKGMVLDADDPDTRSVGSFFTNPVLTAERYAALLARCAEQVGPDVAVPSWPEEDGGAAKISAAWLIEKAGFHRGYRRGRVAISSKHTLALTNADGGSTAELLDLAREIRDGVVKAFDVELHPEPVLVGVTF
ncbi:MAG: UDP-N-acetylmuramate dehydrogenase [Actinocatenispora sp.]